MGIGDFMKPEQRGSVSLLLTEDTFLLLVLHVPSGWQLRFLGFPPQGKPALPVRAEGWARPVPGSASALLFPLLGRCRQAE